MLNAQGFIQVFGEVFEGGVSAGVSFPAAFFGPAQVRTDVYISSWGAWGAGAPNWASLLGAFFF